MDKMVGSRFALNEVTATDGYPDRGLVGGRCKADGRVSAALEAMVVSADGVATRLATHAAIPIVTRLARCFLGARSTRRRTAITSREHVTCMTDSAAARNGVYGMRDV